MGRENSSEPMPPPHLQGEELEEWWNEQLGKEGLSRIETLSDWERECPRCGDINPCTGVKRCVSCGHSLKDAKRLPNSNRFNSRQY
jgi:phage FluMu protein Com